MEKKSDITEWRKGYAKVVAQAWSDETYKDGLLRDPRAVLAEAGLEVPASFELTVVEDSADKRHLVLPRKPEEGEINEEVLTSAAGGLCGCGGGPYGSIG